MNEWNDGGICSEHAIASAEHVPFGFVQIFSFSDFPSSI